MYITSENTQYILQKLVLTGNGVDFVFATDLFQSVLQITVHSQHSRQRRKMFGLLRFEGL